ncbi:MAG TPA: hypothetical protein VI299_02210 [Polyangiales bacterium]
MRDLVVYGLGELGQLYGAAALRTGMRVIPITRSVDPHTVLTTVAPDTPIMVAVGEDALPSVLDVLGPRLAHAILLQNELFPSAWQARGQTPTVLVAWLLKKRGTPLSIARPSPAFGRHAELVEALHAALAIPTERLLDEQALGRAIVEKYAFIVTINALGLLRDRTLGTWLQEDPLRVRALAEEASRLGARLCEVEIDLAHTAQVVAEGMHALGTMSARGRSAEARVARALAHGARLGLDLPALRAART